MNSLKNIKVVESFNGSLLPIEFSNLPFTPKRAFLTFGVPSGEVRGRHATKKNKQVLFCAAGEIFLSLKRRDGYGESVFLRRGDFKFVDNMTWNELTFYNGAVLLSLCSEEYDKEDYITNYKEFILCLI